MSLYMKYGKPDIKGAVTAKGYKDWLEINSLSFGFQRPVEMKTGQSAQSWKRGTVQVDNISCSRIYDKASPLIQRFSLGGGKECDAEIHWVETVNGAPDKVAVIKLKNCLIVSYATQDGSGADAIESFDINYTDFEIEYFGTEGGGTKKPGRAHFDVFTGKT